PCRRLVEEEQARSPHEAGAEIEAPALPTRVRAHRAVGDVVEGEAGDDRRSPRSRLAAPGPVQAGDELEVLATGHRGLHRGVLTGKTDAGAHRCRFAHDVVAVDP